jgi:hypothetical protein
MTALEHAEALILEVDHILDNRLGLDRDVVAVLWRRKFDQALEAYRTGGVVNVDAG